MSLIPFIAISLKSCDVLCFYILTSQLFLSQEGLTSALTCPSNLLSSGSLVILLFQTHGYLSVLTFLMLVAAFDIVDSSFREKCPFLAIMRLLPPGYLLPSPLHQLCGCCFFVHPRMLESLRHLTQVLLVVPDSSQSLWASMSVSLCCRLSNEYLT